MTKPKTGQALLRENLRKEYWPNEVAWTGEGEKGWFRAPRTLPLILNLLASKEVSGNLDPGPVYLEVLARHRGEGIVEMASESDHTYAAGYTSPRRSRTWMERMNLLEKLGFIRAQGTGNAKYSYVLLVHPSIPVKKLYDEGKIKDVRWWPTYRKMQLEAKETKFEDLVLPEKPAENVVQLKPATKKKLTIRKKA